MRAVYDDESTARRKSGNGHDRAGIALSLQGIWHVIRPKALVLRSLVATHEEKEENTSTTPLRGTQKS
jgi:hypothetical protein